MTRKAKDEMMVRRSFPLCSASYSCITQRFADEIIQLLPIKFREQQVRHRPRCESESRY